eukprot:TRINITY_DN5485_c0_g1_i1.p1 TRINITY_DN5485_c0_g1~~TRINITY_DN5485_c0_g1_i1.p1  ORF type:complete len:105 (-),score=5.92 TRINITY_DN5485_c0_g1_i1:106-420(-)
MSSWSSAFYTFCKLYILKYTQWPHKAIIDQNCGRTKRAFTLPYYLHSKLSLISSASIQETSSTPLAASCVLIVMAFKGSGKPSTNFHCLSSPPSQADAPLSTAV